MPNPAYQQVAKVIVDKASNLSEAEKKALKGLLDGFDDQPQPFPSYTVTVNYDQTVEQLIKAVEYDWFNDDVTSRHFPSSEKGKAEVLIYLVNFNRDISSSEDALKELDRQGLRPATLKELLALGVAQPDLQRNNLIVALGSTWRVSGDVRVPFLDGLEPTRGLDLAWWDGAWDSGWQFATVRK